METESSQSRESSLNGEDDEEQVMLPRWIVSRILEVLSKYLKSWTNYIIIMNYEAG